ncbi:MAG: phosphoenolpyruvate carboxykinase (ATP), partial [Bacteriovoracaceae bacterium]|nr:phosphoenolpyruvate carboxykinase (ATP) [Bacteriovoracaceae bacterium]
GPYGEGSRFPLDVTRKIIRSIQANNLDEVKVEKDPIFGLQIPLHIEGVETDMLQPQRTWDNQGEYVPKAQELAQSFHKQMEKFGNFYQDNIEGAPTFKA